MFFFYQCTCVNGDKHLFLSRTSDNSQHVGHISRVRGRHDQSINTVQQAVGLRMRISSHLPLPVVKSTENELEGEPISELSNTTMNPPIRPHLFNLHNLCYPWKLVFKHPTQGGISHSYHHKVLQWADPGNPLVIYSGETIVLPTSHCCWKLMWPWTFCY